ncbi:MAG: leucine--tRNA ligase [Patescibacteria group bacterium]
MDSSYKAIGVEQKWQKKWDKSKLYKVDLKSKKPKYYNLVMFPYPSGDKLHVGHWYNYGPADSWGRYKRMNGFNVLEPMGFDSFGLPAENYAIKTGVPPQESTARNVKYMIKQLSAIGTMYDWEKMVNTSEPEYYKWTQWVFLELYKKGLAYKKEAPVNWCPGCMTVLANEQVQEGKCERCGSLVTPKNLNQWFFKISNYAENLLDHSKLDWPEKTKVMQTNWIGRSEGVFWQQKIKDFDIKIEAFDSVPQTYMAQTFAVIAPEHPLVAKLVKGTKQEKAVMAFVEKVKKKKMANKFDVEADSEGIFTGRYIDNPFGTGDLPLWIASFVVMGYGSGIVNCSAHDERDFAFAKKYNIPLKPVMAPADPVEAKKVMNLEYCYHHDPEAIMQLPEKFKGRKWGEARKDIIKYVEEKGIGKAAVNYKLKDWLISRQRYWGAPIPMINCKKCGMQPVPKKDLPVILPIKGVDYKPKGKAPLASVPKFVNTKCPKCGGKAEREVDTLDTFMCSSWYYLRYLSAKDKVKAFDMAAVKKWLPVDTYIGGPEHACMHLLYARFIHKVLMDDKKAEPFKRLVHQGLITKDGAKMSKSKGNVVSPDEFVAKYGSDVFRMYLMFMGPFTEGGDWSDKGITGIARFTDRFWRLISDENVKVEDAVALKRTLHKLIKRIKEDIEKMQFNTAVAALMEFVNFANKNGVDKAGKKIIAQLIAPLAPHLAEECWELLGNKTSVFDSKWPTYDPKLAVDSTVRIGVQVNGKVRGEIEISKDANKEEAFKSAKSQENVLKYLAQGQVVKEIYVPGKIIGFVVK